MYHRLVGGATTLGSHRQSVYDESSIGTGIDRPAHCHLRTGVEHDTAKDLAFSRLHPSGRRNTLDLLQL